MDGAEHFSAEHNKIEETQLQKQLRKAMECFGEGDYFKAVCCYSKVSQNSSYLIKARFIQGYLGRVGDALLY